MPSFGDLPPEILSEIFQLFCPHCSTSCEEDAILVEEPKWAYAVKGLDWKARRKDLRNLCLVSKKVKGQAQPVLFHHFGILSHDSSGRSLFQFCLAIFKNSSLGKKVKILRLIPTNETEWASSQEMGQLMPMFGQLMPRLDLSPHMLHLYIVSKFAMLHLLPAVAVLLTPKVRELDVTGCYQRTLFNFIRPSPNPLELLLPELRYLNVKIPGDTSVDPQHNALSFRANFGQILGDLPKLKLLKLSMLVDLRIDIPGSLNLRNISDLHLDFTVLAKGQLERIIRATEGLEIFSYCEHGNDIETAAQLNALFSGMGGLGANVNEIFEVLKLRKNTLKEITVHTYYREQLVLESITSFTKLELLHLDDGAFFDAFGDRTLAEDALCGILPHSLSKLIITTTAIGIKSFEKPLVRFCIGNPDEDIYPDPAALSLRLLYLTVYSSRPVDREDTETRLLMGGESYWMYRLIGRFERDCGAWWEGGKRWLCCLSPEATVWAWQNQGRDWL